MIDSRNLLCARFGCLEAIEHRGNDQWLCRCGCGRKVLANTDALLSRKVRSCGCRKRFWTIFILGVTLVVGGIEVHNYFKHQTVKRIDSEAAKYGVRAADFEAACTVYDDNGYEHLELPTEDADIAIKCWEILHPVQAEQDNLLDHMSEIAAMVKKRFREYKD
jgi:hypothetical protein